jgi:hypothetical protein
MSNENNGFKQHAIVELFGHNKVAGLVTEQQIGGASFIRVDIPATDRFEAFTKFYHPNAIYAITPTDEETARRAAHHIDQAPVRNWELRLPEPSPKVVQESYIGDDSVLDEF